MNALGPLDQRAIGPDDRDRLAGLFARLSPQSRYRRFLSPKSELNPGERSYFTDVDDIHHVAVAAVDQRDGSIVGVGQEQNLDMIPLYPKLPPAQAEAAGLRRRAISRILKRNRANPKNGGAGEATLTLRLGSPADENQLIRLAALDSATTPTEPVLLAEIDGRLLAALGIADGTAVADPFHLTADLVELLRTRARQLTAAAR